MEFRPLEIKVISAKDLKDVNLFTKMDVYADVSINGDHRTAQRTPVDKDCGSNPKWNYTMRFTVDEAGVRQNRLYLVFRLKSERQLGDRDIGTVQVPIKELLSDQNEKAEHNVNYNVKRPNGKSKGVLNFSYKFGDKFSQPIPQPPPAPIPAGVEAMYVNKHGNNDHNKPVMAYPPPSTGYPAAGPSSGHPYPYPYPPPPAAGGSYPPYGYQQAPAQGYGYPGYPPQGGYGYPPVQKPQKPKKSGMGGAGLGLGLAGGLLGGMLLGDMVDDAYDAGLEDGLDFDF